jgi:multidrug efflux pump subunit AcrB
VIAPAPLASRPSSCPAWKRATKRFLRYALGRHHPRTFFLGTIGLLFAAFILIGLVPPKTLFFPENEPQYVNVFIEAPIGTDIDEDRQHHAHRGEAGDAHHQCARVHAGRVR